MQFTLEHLVSGDEKVAEYYRRAVARWKEIWARPESRNLMDFIIIMPDEEVWFQENCGGPTLGSEIMVAAGMGMLYTPYRGFGPNLDRARDLHSAIRMSSTSSLAGFVVQELGKSYKLFNERAA